MGQWNIMDFLSSTHHNLPSLCTYLCAIRNRSSRYSTCDSPDNTRIFSCFLSISSKILCHTHHMNNLRNCSVQSKVAIIGNWEIMQVRRSEDIQSVHERRTMLVMCIISKGPPHVPRIIKSLVFLNMVVGFSGTAATIHPAGRKNRAV